MKQQEYDTVAELLEALAPNISARALARICGMSESQMLQYKSGAKKIRPKTAARINEGLRTFADELSGYKLKTISKTDNLENVNSKKTNKI